MDQAASVEAVAVVVAVEAGTRVISYQAVCLSSTTEKAKPRSREDPCFEWVSQEQFAVNIRGSQSIDLQKEIGSKNVWSPY